jgi:hypothetical protein
MAQTMACRATCIPTFGSRRRRGCRIPALMVALAHVIICVPAALACEGDCNGDNQVTVVELIKMVSIALQENPIALCPPGDLNGDGAVTIDEVCRAISIALNGCPLLPTPTPQGAQLKLRVTNKQSSAALACFNGVLMGVGAGGLPSRYGCAPTPAAGCTPLCQSVTTNCPQGGCLVDAGNLSPGVWLHQVIVPTPACTPGPPCKPQVQRTRSLLVVDPNAPNTVDWSVFRHVFTVTSSGDDCDVSYCTSNAICTLRCAIQKAASDTLIQFKDTGVLPFAGITVAGDPVNMMANGLVIDGTDQDGNPSALDDFGVRKFKVTIGETGPASSAGQLTFKNQNGQLLGLDITRAQLSDGLDQDVVRFGGGSGSKNNRISTCRLDGSAKDKPTAEGTDPIPATGKDCVDVGPTPGATTGFSDANVIENSELRSCWDRGVKSQNGYMIVRDSWIHNNLRGGLFAMVPNGHIKAERNLIENNGKNGTTASGQVTRQDATQIAAQSKGNAAAASEVQTDGNIIRTGPGRGIFLDDRSVATLANDYVCGITANAVAPGNGLATNANAGPVTVSGTTCVYNAGAGVSVNNNSSTSFGTGSTSGSNAFTQNGTGGNFQNATSPQSQIQAQNNQWQHCGNGAACGSVSADYTGPVAVGTPQAHRNPPAFQIDGFSPSKVATPGALIRILGKGFNAIEGHPTGGNCTTVVAQNNTCGSPPNMTPNGTCVEFEQTFGANDWKPAEVQAVTPTEVVVKWPFSMGCSNHVRVRVRRRNTTSSGYDTALAPSSFCTN